MIKTYHNGININSSLPIPLKLALQDLSNKLGRAMLFKYTVTTIAYEMVIEDQVIKFKREAIDTASQEELFDALYDRFKQTEDTWDELLYKSELEQAFHDAAADWAYIV